MYRGFACVRACATMCGDQWFISFLLYVVSRGWLQISRLVREMLLPAKPSLVSVIHCPHIHHSLPLSFFPHLFLRHGGIYYVAFNIQKLSMKTRLVLKHRDSPISASCVVGFKACTTWAWIIYSLIPLRTHYEMQYLHPKGHRVLTVKLQEPSEGIVWEEEEDSGRKSERGWCESIAMWSIILKS